MKRFVLIFICLCSMMTTQAFRSPEDATFSKTKEARKARLQANCSVSISQTDLNVNNVRAKLLAGGDMWWNLSDGQYIVPINDPGTAAVSSIFTGALWLGGYDEGGNLKIAAQTYRQNGNDFWSGPLDQGGEVDQSTCAAWDRHFTVYGQDITALISDYYDSTPGIQMTPSSGILGWPAKGNPHFASLYGFNLPNQSLAPFYDRDSDGIYDPMQGDFPIIKVSSSCENITYADQMTWWITNDKGNLHTETGGEAMNMEVHNLAYAFAGNGAVNNTTFYQYKMIYKGFELLNNMRIGQWTDVDLGCYDNDFIGCNVDRSLGIGYNGTPTDPNCSGVYGYGDNVPMIAIDFLQMPKNENGVETNLGSFMYYNNSNTTTGHPQIATDFYNYLSGFWKDGTPIEYGGNGYQTGGGATLYMYPDAPTNSAGWSECTANNPPNDRRMLMSSEAFMLQPGAINTLDFAVEWTPNTGGGCGISFDAALATADEIQALFDDCFQIFTAVDELEEELVNSVTIAPNPFSIKNDGQVQLSDLPQNSTIQVYTLDGRLVKTLFTRQETQLTWDLTNESGQQISKGMYFFGIQGAKGQKQVVKCLAI